MCLNKRRTKRDSSSIVVELAFICVWLSKIRIVVEWSDIVDLAKIDVFVSGWLDKICVTTARACFNHGSV